MRVQLKKLGFRRFVANAGQMYSLLDANRARLAPWFWWADKSITPTKFRFYVFLVSYLAMTKRKKFGYILHHDKPYDEQFFIYNDQGKIAGMCGLDDIDTQTAKNAELWYLTFYGNKFGTADSAIKIIENYSINKGLNSLYCRISQNNEKSINFITRNGFAASAPQNPTKNYAITFTKTLAR